MSLYRVLPSEWMKTKRTATRLLVILIPLVYPTFMLWYFSRYNKIYSWQIQIYIGFFEVISVALPIIAALLTGLMVFQEEEAGNFNGFLAEPVSRIELYTSKLILLILLTVIDVFVATLLMLLGMRFILHVVNIQYCLFFQGALWVVVGSLIFYSMHLPISFAYGMGASIAVGGVGTLISAIVGATAVGDTIWPFIPWAWAIRLSKNPVVLMPGVTLLQGVIPSKFFFRELSKGVIPSVMCFLFVTGYGIRWFDSWEGRKYYE